MTKTAWSEFQTERARYLSKDFDLEAFDILLAAIVAHHGNGVPVWINVNGPPSNGKTAMLDTIPCQPLPTPKSAKIKDGIITLDALTPRTLVSGMAEIKRPGLLERIDNGVLIIKDLAQQMTGEGQREVFAQLRRIYDGEQALAFGSGKTFQWKGRLTLLCASVRHPWSFDAELGARFLCVSARRAEYSDTVRAGQSKLKKSVEKLLASTCSPQVTLTESVKTMPLAKALARCRAAIIRDGYRRDIVEEPIIESPHRLTHQLASLLSALQLMRREKIEVSYQSIVRVVTDTIPHLRRGVLASLFKYQMRTVDELAEDLALESQPNETMIRRAVEELTMLQLVAKATVGITDVYKPGALWNLLENAPGLLPAL